MRATTAFALLLYLVTANASSPPFSVIRDEATLELLEQIDRMDEVAALGVLQESQWILVDRALDRLYRLQSPDDWQETIETLMLDPRRLDKGTVADLAFGHLLNRLGAQQADVYRRQPRYRRNLLSCCVPRLIESAASGSERSGPGLRLAVEQLKSPSEFTWDGSGCRDNLAAGQHIIWSDNVPQLRELAISDTPLIALSALQALTRHLDGEALLALAVTHANRAERLNSTAWGCISIIASVPVAVLAWQIIADYLDEPQRAAYFEAISEPELANDLLLRSARQPSAVASLDGAYRALLQADEGDYDIFAAVAALRDPQDLPRLLQLAQRYPSIMRAFAGWDHPRIVDWAQGWWQRHGRNPEARAEGLDAFLELALSLESHDGRRLLAMAVDDAFSRQDSDLIKVLMHVFDYRSDAPLGSELGWKLLDELDFVFPVDLREQPRLAPLMRELTERTIRWSAQELETHLIRFYDGYDRRDYCEQLVEAVEFLDDGAMLAFEIDRSAACSNFDVIEMPMQTADGGEPLPTATRAAEPAQANSVNALALFLSGLKV